MLIQEGFAYHVKDEYFEKAQDSRLMQNKENGAYRPTFYCLHDENTSLLWMVPISSRVEKYQAIYDKQVQRYGNCLGIVLGEFDGKKAAFLLQNMFPVAQHYLDHVHTKNGNPVPVNYSIGRTIRSNMKRLRLLSSKGKNVVFPDIARLERLMLDELIHSPIAAQIVAAPQPTQHESLSFADQLADAKRQAAELNRQLQGQPPVPDRNSHNRLV